MRFLQKNWFILALIGAILLGFVIPGWGIGLNPASITSTILVSLLFLIAGLTLPSEALKTGLMNFRLHIFVQIFIFIIVPLYFVTSSFVFKNRPEVLIGIYSLAILPTTVSSCIVFTQVSKGNVAGTAFNATLANVAGVFISPLLLSLLLKDSGRQLPTDEILRIFLSLGYKMLLPLIIGQVLRRWIPSFARAQKKRLSLLSNAFIVVIVFFVFSKTSNNPVFRQHLGTMLLPFLYLAVSHIALLLLAYVGARLIGLKPDSIISVLYAAPQKTLSMGVPLLSTFFAGSPELIGFALLPILFYHPWQLLTAGILKSSPLMRSLQKG